MLRYSVMEALLRMSKTRVFELLKVYVLMYTT